MTVFYSITLPPLAPHASPWDSWPSNEAEGFVPIPDTLEQPLWATHVLEVLRERFGQLGDVRVVVRKS